MISIRLSLSRHVSALLVFMALAVGACQESPLDLNDEEDRAAPAMAAMAESYHELADVAVEAGDLLGAEQAMRDLIDAMGRDGGRTPSTQELGMDAFGRLGRILMDQNRHEDALIIANQGLAYGEDLAKSSIFAGYLHQLRGDILRNAGDDRNAVKAHKAAILVFKSILETHADSPQGAP